MFMPQVEVSAVPFSAVTLTVDWQEEHAACKNSVPIILRCRFQDLL